jgi:hypothetical protein
LNFHPNTNFYSYCPEFSSSEGPTYKHRIVRRGKGNFALTKWPRNEHRTRIAMRTQWPQSTS